MRKMAILLAVVAVLLCNWFVIQFCEIDNLHYSITFDISSSVEDTFQCFYMTESGEWSHTSYCDYWYDTPGAEKTLKYSFPSQAKAFRIDTGNNAGIVSIKNLNLACMTKTVPIELNRLQRGSEGVGEVSFHDGSVLVNNIGTDPYVICLLSETESDMLHRYLNILNIGLKVLLLTALNSVFLMAIKKRSVIYSVARELKNSRDVIWRLSINDLKSRFSQSFLGVIWAFVQPLMTILVFWFVFQVGLRNGDIENVPYILWYAVAFVAWTFFADTVQSTTNCLREYGYLVRKIQFNVDIIPVVKVVSGCVVHVAFIIFLFFLCLFYEVNLTLHCLQVVYYFACTVVLLLGLGWLLSAISLFAGDVASCVGVIVQIGFWATPIVWVPETMSSAVQTIMKFNPMYYICSGYRDAFIGQQWFWERGWVNAYYWIVVLSVFLIGITIFRKLKHQFADVL